MRRLVVGLVVGALFGTFGVSMADHDPAEQISLLRMQVSTLEIQVSSLGSQVSTLRSEISYLRSLVLTR